MTVLINLENVFLSYGSEVLLDHVDLQVRAGERVCLIGRNGAGKSSFLKIIDDTISPDDGKIHRQSGFKISRLEQELPQEAGASVYATIGTAFEHYALEDWEVEQKIQGTLERLELDGTQQVMALSGGWQRRVALAKALVIEPDLLLLDEPTNHLDIEAIQWLEKQLLQFKGGILFITHDRWLLRRLATRIIELDRGQLTSWPGDYDNFIRRKEEMLAAEAHQSKEFDKKLAEEERWIRQGIKARRTRNEGRVRALKAMRKERQQRRELQGTVSLSLNEVTRSGQLVIEAEQASYYYDANNKTTNIIDQFSTRVMRGDRIGLLGPNGVGKTTLLNVLLGKLLPTSGIVKLGTKLEVAYFDQLRETLDPELSILDNLSGGRSSIVVNGKDKHVISYLSDFLFPPKRVHTLVKALSGGECNRLLLAKLFSLPANVLVMDEPTNDLDIETLELLEELLSQFSGTLLLVSHDREFIDNIVTRTLVLEGEGKVSEFVGGYQDWLEQTRKINNTIKTVSPTKNIADIKLPANSGVLSYEERKELAKIPEKVEKLEKKQQMLFDEMAQEGFYDQSEATVNHLTQQLKLIEKEITQLYGRWEMLEAKS